MYVCAYACVKNIRIINIVTVFFPHSFFSFFFFFLPARGFAFEMCKWVLVAVPATYINSMLKYVFSGLAVCLSLALVVPRFVSPSFLHSIIPSFHHSIIPSFHQGPHFPLHLTGSAWMLGAPFFFSPKRRFLESTLATAFRTRLTECAFFFGSPFFLLKVRNRT
jgi:hypothetical protein